MSRPGGQAGSRPIKRARPATSRCSSLTDAASRWDASEARETVICRQLAALRARESERGSGARLFDPYSLHLAGPAAEGQTLTDELDIASIVWLDNKLLDTVLLLDPAKHEPVNQVVLVGDGLDSRPFRLTWPTGTVIFLVSTAEMHEIAAGALAEQRPSVPTGCVLRRVAVAPGEALGLALKGAGYSPERLSVWGVESAVFGQVLMPWVLRQAGELAAHGSAVAGTVPPGWTAVDMEATLAVVGLLGSAGPPGAGDEDGSPPGLVFFARQQRLSDAQMALYDSHSAAAEEQDEDFFGNFS